MRALWLVHQVWVIVPVNPRKNRASSAARGYEFFECSTNIPSGLSAYNP